MIVELVEAITAATAAGAATGIALRRRRARLLPTRHELCLREIDRLERELFPEWFPQPSVVERKRQVERQLLIAGFDVDEYDFSPGAMWPVEHGNHVHIVKHGVLSMSTVSSQFPARVSMRRFDSMP